MVQLSDDCFAFSEPLMPIAEMERLIVERIEPVAEIEQVLLRKAAGRVLADDIAARIDLPPFDNSAVDGYALRHGDLHAQADTRLAVIDRVAAGQDARRGPAAGEAIRIFTGAPMPPGADTVVMQEDARLDGDYVIVPPGLARGANRRIAGEDIRAGAAMLPAGRRLSPQDLALAAAQGMPVLPVRRRVAVALFSTGDELVEPGDVRKTGAIYDANRFLLIALLEKLGAQVTDLGILRDQPDAVADALSSTAAAHDLVLTSGGVSTGEADHVRTAVARAGRLVFWRIAIKPGRPVAMGVLSDRNQNGSAVFVGLPGNPAAVFVIFARVVRPLLLRLAGATPHPLIALPVRAGFSYRKKRGRREYVRVSLRRGDDGAVEAVKFPRDGAGVITSLTATDGLVELDEETTAVAPGATVSFLPYAVITE